MMPTQNQGRGAVVALLQEYQKAVAELQLVIRDISPENLVAIVDAKTENPDCRSIQTILAHVVRSGFSYNVYIQNFRNIAAVRPEKIFRESAAEFVADLDLVVEYSYKTFETIYDSDIEFFDTNNKINTAWNQQYDIEQLMEHAIVHILRHRRQIERFLKVLSEK